MGAEVCFINSPGILTRVQDIADDKESEPKTQATNRVELLWCSLTSAAIEFQAKKQK
jgi:hypothetical protein